MPRPTASLPHPNSEVARPVGKILVLAREWFLKLQNIADRSPVTGTATFAAGTSIAVVFATPEVSTDYLIVSETNANRTYWVTSKTVTGFTLNASGSNSDTVLWTMLRT